MHQVNPPKNTLRNSLIDPIHSREVFRRLAKMRLSSILLITALVLISKATFGQQKVNKGIDTKRPNVLFIVIDDLNDYVTPLKGFPGLKTPNLDKFIQSATNFTKAYCAAPVCNPSRSAFLSGVAPYRSGVYDNDNRITDSHVLDSAVFIPEHFKANGYITLSRGKIFHSSPEKSRYDAMWDFEGGKGNYGPATTVHNVPRSLKVPPMFDYQPWTGPDSDHPDNVTAETITDWLNKPYEKPFFMAAGLYKPHNPWTAPKRFFEMYPLESIKLPPVLESDWDDLPEIAKEWASGPVNYEALKKSGLWKNIVQSYLACISFMDWNFGRIIAALDNSRYKDNTIVCVLADNGFHMGEKKHFAKYALWEQTTHILHMWRVPGVTKAGLSCDQPVNLLDVYPTLVELCNLSQPAFPLDGKSIVTLLKDPKSDWKEPSVTTYRQGNQAIRDNRYRYIRYKDGTEELYDELKDPNEWYNLAKDSKMEAIIAKFRKQVTPDFVPPARPAGGKKGNQNN